MLESKYKINEGLSTNNLKFRANLKNLGKLRIKWKILKQRGLLYKFLGDHFVIKILDQGRKWDLKKVWDKSKRKRLVFPCSSQPTPAKPPPTPSC